MGLDVLEPIVNMLRGLQYSGVSHWLALVGLGIIFSIGLAYAIYGIIKLGKLVLSLRVKEFTMLLLIVGVVLLGLALVLP